METLSNRVFLSILGLDLLLQYMLGSPQVLGLWNYFHAAQQNDKNVWLILKYKCFSWFLGGWRFATEWSHSCSLPEKQCFFKANSFLQRRWSLLPHQLRLLITERLSVNIWPLSFSETQHPLTSMCSAAHTDPGISKHRNKCTGKRKVGILTCWNKHTQAYYSTSSSHPWPFLCVCD